MSKHLYQQATPPVVVSGGGGIPTWLLIAGGAVLVMALSKNGVPKDAKISKGGKKFAENATTEELHRMLETDKSPNFYKQAGNKPLSKDEQISLLDKIRAKFKENKTLKFDIDPNLLSNALAYTLQLADKSMGEETFKRYMIMYAAWADQFNKAFIAAGVSIAQVVKSSGENINNATECTQWTWSKVKHETVEQYHKRDTTIVHTNSATSGLLGALFNHGRSSEQWHMTDIRQMNESRDISFIPHCTQSQIDPAKVFGILIAQEAAIKDIWSPLQAIAKMAPVLK